MIKIIEVTLEARIELKLITENPDIALLKTVDCQCCCLLVEYTYYVTLYCLCTRLYYYY